MAMGGTRLYFAYGSNLCLTQMAGRCPSAEVVGRAVLLDHALVFPRRSIRRNCGVASFEPCLGRAVWGAVYRLTARDILRLDDSEGCDPVGDPRANAYNRIDIEVLLDARPDEPSPVFTYLAVPMQGLHRPSGDYHATILRGARAHGLPHDYIAALERIEIQKL